MNTIKSIAEQLLTSMASHGDDERLIAECCGKADRIVSVGFDFTTATHIFHFPDSSRIEYNLLDKYIRAFSDREV